MKTRVYVRVAKGPRGAQVAMTQKPNHGALTSGREGKYLPTVAFALDLDVPDALFKRAELAVAELRVTEDSAQIAAELRMT
jgi:hypothetical protein